MILGIKHKSLYLILILVISIFSVTNFPNANSDLSISSVLITRDPISITNNSHFNSTNGVVSGNGTKTNPFIIENWAINAENKTGIVIAYTDVHFVIRNCHIFNGGNNDNYYAGISLNDVSNGIVENNRLINNYYGIVISGGKSNFIINNTCKKNKNGIDLGSNTKLNYIINNECKFNEIGIYLWHAHSNYIIDNLFSNNNEDGIYNRHCDYNIITNNICMSNNEDGIYNRHCNYNIISNNTCMSNNDDGIYNWFANNCTISNNTCMSNNDDGITIRSSDNNLIYNNYLKNNNANLRFSSGIGNTWHIPKTAGKNIVGGPYLGGNYWSDYTGIDTNGDGFGNTNLPYYPGDYLPLIDNFNLDIIDNTSGHPMTGDPFTINATVINTGTINNIYVEYWFDSDTPLNKTMKRTQENNIYRNYSIILTVPNEAIKLSYLMSVQNQNDEWFSTQTKVLNVVDINKSLTNENLDIPIDTDNDGLPDEWEMGWFNTLEYDGENDPDSDGRNNRIEYINNTNPTQPDKNNANGTSAKPKRENDFIFLTLIVIISGIIIIVILIFFLLIIYKRKKINEKPGLTSSKKYTPPSERNWTLPDTQNETQRMLYHQEIFLKQYESQNQDLKYYTLSSQKSESINKYYCQSCGLNLSYIKKNNRYYCFNCGKFE